MNHVVAKSFRFAHQCKDRLPFVGGGYQNIELVISGKPGCGSKMAVSVRLSHDCLLRKVGLHLLVLRPKPSYCCYQIPSNLMGEILRKILNTVMVNINYSCTKITTVALILGDKTMVSQTNYTTSFRLRNCNALYAHDYSNFMARYTLHHP